MQATVKPRAMGMFLSLMILNSCVSQPYSSIHILAPELPADVTMNREAGRGNWLTPDANRGRWLFLTLRLENGQELPFFVDTGANATLFDKSLEPMLGKRLNTISTKHFSATNGAGVYAAPKIYLGNIPLMTGPEILTGDLRQPSSEAGRPVMGILGMDCLRHYCIQLDFEAGKMCFLGHGHLEVAELGETFPLTFHWGLPFIYGKSLIESEITNVLIDTGYNKDGALDSEAFRREVREQRLRAEGDPVNNRRPQHAAWLSECSWNGHTYTNLMIGDGGRNLNLIGLRFLARHLVTFDFPGQTMYLKQKSIGPLSSKDGT